MKRTFHFAVAIALMLLVLELTYINAKSLLYLVSDSHIVDKTFAVIGSLAFSVVTVLVMRTSSTRWMRVVFPCFDALLVFCGFNLKYADNLLGNPVAFYLTIFLAVFTGLIMYSLGSIGSKLAQNNQQPAANNLQPAGNLQPAAGNLQHTAKGKNVELQVTAKQLQPTAVNVQPAGNQQTATAVDSYTCSICNREFASDASRRSHEGHCRKNFKKLAV